LREIASLLQYENRKANDILFESGKFPRI